MSFKPDEPKAPLPRWLLLPLVLGISLTIVGLAMPTIYPQESLWTDEDAKKHQELGLQAHAAHHASGNAKVNKLPTAKEDAAKAQWYREQFDKSANKLKQVRNGGNNYGWWLMTSGLLLTGIGVAWALALRRE